MDIAKFVSEAPPGEVDAVRRDIEVFTNSSNAVERQIASELAKSDVQHLRPIVVKGEPTVVSEYNRIKGSTFRTSKGIRFEFDHVKGEASVSSPSEDEEADDAPSPEAKRLLDQVRKYTSDHYPDGDGSVSEVFDLRDEDAVAVVIIGRRLSPANLHNGQWTSQYVVRGSDIKGSISVDVHFFEDGNVRLKSETKVNVAASRSGAGPVVEAIEKAENDFETQLHRTLVDLNENEFKALRRTLPMTREKIDWNKAMSGLKLGRELEGN